MGAAYALLASNMHAFCGRWRLLQFAGPAVFPDHRSEHHLDFFSCAGVSTLWMGAGWNYYTSMTVDQE